MDTSDKKFSVGVTKSHGCNFFRKLRRAMKEFLVSVVYGGFLGISQVSEKMKNFFVWNYLEGYFVGCLEGYLNC